MASDSLRQDLVDQVREEQQKQRRAPRVHRAPRADAPAGISGTGVQEAAAPHASPADAPADGAPARKRRRRRRPGGGGGAPGAGNTDGGAGASD